MSVGISSLARAGKGSPTVNLPTNTVISVPVGAILESPRGFQKDARPSNQAQIKAFGITEPVVLWAKEGELVLLRGANTLKSAKALEIAQVPAIVLSVGEEDAKAFCKQANAPSKTETAQSNTDASIHEEKFRVAKSVKTELPYYLL